MEQGTALKGEVYKLVFEKAFGLFANFIVKEICSYIDSNSSICRSSVNRGGRVKTYFNSIGLVTRLIIKL